MLFLLSKILWAILAPGPFLILLMAVGLAMSFCPKGKRCGRILSITATTCLLLIAIFPIGDWALTPLENRFTFNPPEQVAGIIVIGGDEQSAITQARGVPTAYDSMRRYLTFAELAKKYPDAQLVFSGGSVYPSAEIHVHDADVARDLLAAMGVPVDHMMFEKESRNTYENATFSAALVHPDPSQKWLLVTTAWHMPRAIGCFRKAGWNIDAAPAGYTTTGTYSLHPMLRFDEQIHALTTALHEYVGLISYWLLGRTSTLWPQ